MTTIRFRRGREASRGQIIPADGEPIWASDQKKLYIGDGVTKGGIMMDKFTFPSGVAKDNLVVFADTTGYVLKGVPITTFLADYYTISQIDAKIAAVPATLVNEAKLARDSNLLKGRADYLTPDIITQSYTEAATNKVSSANAVKGLYDWVVSKVNELVASIATKLDKSALSGAVNSTSTTTAATSAALKITYDLADSAGAKGTQGIADAAAAKARADAAFNTATTASGVATSADTAAKAASLAASKASTDAQAASAAAAKATTVSEGADDKAETAVGTANSANSVAAKANTTAEAAKADAAKANTAIGVMSPMVTKAQSTADNATTIATAAKADAAKANTAVATAQSTANTAQSAATEARSAPDLAADRKRKINFGGKAPTGAAGEGDIFIQY